MTDFKIITSIPEIQELWLPAPRYESRYEVSNIGRVRNKSTGRILKGFFDKDGYRKVGLYDGTRRQPLNNTVHSLVAIAFIGPRPEGLVINHINTIKSDNDVNNLEYITDRANKDHAKLHGCYPCGTNVAKARFQEEEVLQIRKLTTEGFTDRWLAQKYNTTSTAIRNIRIRFTWKHLPL